VIGEGCLIADGAVVGKSPRLARGFADALAPLRLGARVTVCVGAVMYAAIGDEAIVGDQAQVRERTAIGGRTVSGAPLESTTTCASALASSCSHRST
jgi:carbonic anhydrase/acetyltransferase-like protein (isoleucine patch superfamily)